MDNKLHREVYADLRKKGVSKKMTYDQYLGRMKNRNEAIARKDYEARKIKMKGR